MEKKNSKMQEAEPEIQICGANSSVSELGQMGAQTN